MYKHHNSKVVMLRSIRPDHSSFHPRPPAKLRLRVDEQLFYCQWIYRNSYNDFGISSKIWGNMTNILVISTSQWQVSTIYTSKILHRYQKWPYFKGVHLLQTIILGIQPLAFGDVHEKDLKPKTIQICPGMHRNSHIRYHKSQDFPFPHPHRTPFLVQRFTSRLACSRVPRGSMTPKATNIFAEIKALRMEFEFCYMGLEDVGHHNSFWKSFRPCWLFWWGYAWFGSKLIMYI